MQPQRRPNSDRSPESLEARLRALPSPPMPSDLEARLLADIPSEMPRGARISRPRRWAVWIGGAGALAAACLLIVLIWHELDGKNLVAGPGKNPGLGAVLTTPPSRRPPDNPAGIAALQETRGILDEAEVATFTWPIQEKSPLMVSTSITPELLD
jgi:hypothetical protein